jgi:hypothetical protein
MSILSEFKFTRKSPLFFKNDFHNDFEVKQVKLLQTDSFNIFIYKKQKQIVSLNV